MMTGNEGRLRELILLRSERTGYLATADEEQLLESAVAQFDMPLSRAKGIMIAAAESTGVEIESDLNRVAEAMILSLAGQQMTISSSDFDLVAKYYSQKLRMPMPYTRARLKDIVNRAGVSPRRSGWLFSARWFRSIKPWTGPSVESLEV